MKKFSKYFDHTLLKPDASVDEIDTLCDEAIEYDFASVCVNGCRVDQAYAKLKDTDINVAAVIGFPLGAMSMESKVYEAEQAIEAGASEIDMVINIGAVKDGSLSYVREEIGRIADVCRNGMLVSDPVILKVILETCLLSDEEITELCDIAVDVGADFVKTSTGFSTGGAEVHQIELMRQCVSSNAKIKASGGIRTLESAEAFIAAGADRLGCSASVSIMKEYMNKY